MKTLDDLTTEEWKRAAAMVAELHKHGYADRKLVGELAAGARIRHRAHRWPEAYRDGTGVIVAVTERDPSPWSLSWGMRDIEMVVAFDKPTFVDWSRLSQLAQYHVDLVDTATATNPRSSGGDAS